MSRMKIIQIEKLLNGVIWKLIDEISIQTVREAILRGYITGGCIPSMISGEWVNDYDIYFKSKEDVEIIKEHFRVYPKEENFPVDKFGFIKAFITDNAITLSDHKIQLITKYYGNASVIIEKFDWAHIKSWYDISEEKLYLCPNVHQLLMEKELIYTGSDYPLSSLLRTRKFLKKGWHISTANMVHIIFDVCKVFHNSKTIKDKEIEKLYDMDKIKANPDFIPVENEFNISIDKLIEQLNGVDPLTIQVELERKTGQYLSISEIINLIK